MATSGSKGPTSAAQAAAAPATAAAAAPATASAPASGNTTAATAPARFTLPEKPPGRGHWNTEEHRRFLAALGKVGTNWRKIAQVVETRTPIQVRTHAQKYFLKLRKVENAKLLVNQNSLGGSSPAQAAASSVSTSTAQGLPAPHLRVSGPPPAAAYPGPAAPTAAAAAAAAATAASAAVARGTRQAAAAKNVARVYNHRFQVANQLAAQANKRRKDSAASNQALKISEAVEARTKDRRRPNLSEATTQILRQWLMEHWEYPYPTRVQKRELAATAGIAVAQVANWFVNARARLWKPIIMQMAPGTPEVSKRAALAGRVPRAALAARPGGRFAPAVSPLTAPPMTPPTPQSQSQSGGAAGAGAGSAASAAASTAARPVSRRKARATAAAAAKAAQVAAAAAGAAAASSGAALKAASGGSGRRVRSVAVRTAAAAAAAAGHAVERNRNSSQSMDTSASEAVALSALGEMANWRKQTKTGSTASQAARNKGNSSSSSTTSSRRARRGKQGANGSSSRKRRRVIADDDDEEVRGGDDGSEEDEEEEEELAGPRKVAAKSGKDSSASRPVRSSRGGKKRASKGAANASEDDGGDASAAGGVSAQLNQVIRTMNQRHWLGLLVRLEKELKAAIEALAKATEEATAPTNNNIAWMLRKYNNVESSFASALAIKNTIMTVDGGRFWERAAKSSGAVGDLSPSQQLVAGCVQDLERVRGLYTKYAEAKRGAARLVWKRNAASMLNRSSDGNKPSAGVATRASDLVRQAHELDIDDAATIAKLSRISCMKPLRSGTRASGRAAASSSS